MLEVTYSNRVEELFLHFINKQYEKTLDHPFLERLIVVPNLTLKCWIIEHLPDGLALGFKIVLLDEALFYLRKECAFPQENTRKVPNKLELSLAIENLMPNVEELSEWACSNDKRRCYLAEMIATLFQKYGRLYQAETSESLTGWQKKLWDSLYKDSLWTNPAEYYSITFQTPKRPLQVDLFGLSFLSPLEFMFLKELSAFIPIRFYLLSPCLHFWSDLASENEKKFLLKQASASHKTSLEQFLDDSNPLLAGWGFLGRELSKLIETELPDHTQAYVVGKQTLDKANYNHFEEAARVTDEPVNLLKMVQADLLYLRKPDHKINIDNSDVSLQGHRLSSKLREVEWAKDLILKLYSEFKTDILVVAPDIDLYAPYIECTLSDNPKIHFTLSGEKTLKDHPLCLIFDYYLEEHKDLLALAPHAGFDFEELILLEEWRNEFQLNSGSIENLMFSYIQGKTELSDLDLIQKWNTFLTRLKTGKPHGVKKLHDWVFWLDSLPLMKKNGEDPLSEKLLKMANLPVTFYTFSHHVKKLLLNLKTEEGQSNLNQVRFCSINEAAAISCQACIFIGMHEGAFPRASSTLTFDLFKHLYYPTQTDYDRGLFLDLLLCVKENIYFIWSGTEQPAQAVYELFNYVESGYVKENLFIDHPESGHDSLYFEENSPIKSFSETLWKASMIEPEEIKPFFSDFTPSTKLEITPLSLRELTSLIKKPLEFHLKAQGFKIPFQKFEDDSSEEKIHLDPLEKWKAKIAFLNKNEKVFKTGSLFEELKGLDEEKLQNEIRDYLEGENVDAFYSLRLKPSRELPLHGTIAFATDQGIVSTGDHHLPDIIKVLPEFLAAAYLDAKRTKIFCLKTYKTVELELEALPYLQKLLIYASKAKEAPYPFDPKCIKYLVEGSSRELKEALAKFDTAQDVEHIASKYQIEASELFGVLLKKL